MMDFVSEIKPRLLSSKCCLSAKQKTDFVAEIRPKSCNQALMTTQRDGLCDSDVSDMYIKKKLSDIQFSREGITNFLENSVFTLIEKILTGKSISRIQGTLCVSLSTNEPPIVVDLNKAFPKPCSPTHVVDPLLERNLNVKIKERDLSSLCLPCDKTLSSCSPSYDYNRETCHSPAGSDSSLQTSSGYHTDSSFSGSPYRMQMLSPTQDSNTRSPSQDSNIRSPSQDSHTLSPSYDSVTQNFQHEFCSGNSQLDVDMPSALQNRSSVYDTKSKSSSPQLGDEITTTMRYLEQDTIICRGSENCIENSRNNSSKTTNDVSKKTNSVDEGLNNYFCKGFNGKDIAYIPAVSPASDCSQNKVDCYLSTSGDSDEMDDSDDGSDEESEHRLIIDENPKENGDVKLEHSSEAENENINEQCCKFYMPVDKSVLKERSKQSPIEEDKHKVIDDAEATISSLNSDTIVADVRIKYSGKMKQLLDGQPVIPHPQSIMSIHSEGFSCKQCLTVVPDIMSVSSHVQEKHDLYCCMYCCRTFTAKNNLKRHVRRHTGQKPFHCSQCPKSFFRRDDLKGHTLRHNYNKPYRCSVCKKSYNDRAGVKNHMTRAHRSRLTHVCPQCGESFNHEDSFNDHKRSHPELQLFSCSTCPYIGTNNLMRLKHSLVHSQKLFSCKSCNAYFSDPFQYTSHIKKHRNIPDFSTYVCCFCDVELATYDQYVRHEYSHADEKAYKCTICKMQFRNKTLLQEHATEHEETMHNTDQVCSDTNSDPSPPYSPHRITENGISSDCLSLSSADVSRNLSSVSETYIKLTGSQKSEDDDEFCGQLLDLSMKKPPSKTVSKESLNNGICNTTFRQTDTPVQNFPRNGVVNTESVALSQVYGHKEGELQSSQSMNAEMHVENRNTFAFRDEQLTCDQGISRSRLSQIQKEGIVDAINTKSRLLSGVKFLSRSRNLERTQIISDVPDDLADQKSVQRPILNGKYKTLVRFSPYYKDKIADLAVKFLTARGSRSIGHRTPIKSILSSISGDRKGIVVREKDISTRKLQFLKTSSDLIPTYKEEIESFVGQQVCTDNVEVTGEDSTSGTILGCHIPTVVKSENLLPQIDLSNSALDCRFQSDDAKTNIEAMKSHSCDICKEQFGSFIELENHSVELHKRYMCEHCKKSFTARPNRDRHVRYHTGERPYKCDLCQMAFFRGDDLKYHRTTRHPTAQPFVCNRCSATFTWGRDLERHVRHSKCNVFSEN